jgi:hypothetical protein
VEATRDKLGQLLSELDSSPRDHQCRIEAARTALALCFRDGDPHFADVAESLLVDAPRLTPRSKRAELDKLAAQATATRRAVALAHGQSHANPAKLAEALVGDPAQLAVEIRTRMDAKQHALARAVLEVGLARHQGDPTLCELQQILGDRFPYGFDED